MGYFSGIQGQLLINGTRAARVSNWSFSSSIGLLDTTSLADTDRTSIYGTRTTTGSCTVFYHQPTPGVDGDASTLLNALIKARIDNANPGVAPQADSLVLRMVIDDSTQGGKFLEIDANLTSASMMMAVGTVLQAAISFEANGAPRLMDI